jgi:hypothetical protein
MILLAQKGYEIHIYIYITDFARTENLESEVSDEYAKESYRLSEHTLCGSKHDEQCGSVPVLDDIITWNRRSGNHSLDNSAQDRIDLNDILLGDNAANDSHCSAKLRRTSCGHMSLLSCQRSSIDAIRFGSTNFAVLVVSEQIHN